MKKNIFIPIAIITSSFFLTPILSQKTKSDAVQLEKKDKKMINTGLHEEKRTKLIQQLQKLLANIYVLYVKTQKYHWNVEGKHFHDLHKMFNEQYDSLAQYIDMIAERIRSLGSEAIGTIIEFHEYATLPEHPGQNPHEQTMIADLLEDYETIIRQLRSDIDLTVQVNDMGTNNFLSDLIMKLEKTAWMLRASLEQQQLSK